MQYYCPLTVELLPVNIFSITQYTVFALSLEENFCSRCLQKLLQKWANEWIYLPANNPARNTDNDYDVDRTSKRQQPALSDTTWEKHKKNMYFMHINNCKLFIKQETPVANKTLSIREFVLMKSEPNTWDRCDEVPLQLIEFDTTVAAAAAAADDDDDDVVLPLTMDWGCIEL